MMQKRSKFEQGLLTVLTVMVVIFFMVPVFWLITTSFKFGREAFSIPPKWLFFDFTLRNYEDVLATSKIGLYLTNSLIVSLGATVLSLVLGVPAGYAIARSGSRALNMSAYFFLLLLMVPPVAMLIPFYLIMRDLHLLGSYASLIILDTVFDAAFVVWMMRSYFANVPREIEEAALVDGASRFVAFWRVALPLSIPGIVASALYVIIFSWNDFLFALMLTSPETKTIPLGILSSFSAVEINWGKMAVMCIFAIVPALFISLFLNRYFIQGVTMGATKG
ncbi:carbohydrate ABC transporter permease [Caldilinea sp.]|uniref:carbohydrate ABC transporter permease n=1 Tax=Caldilinea sp. TaxID=2293560 RepID=UPI002C9F91CD|nr:carbohydrate ABC transporter permease [Caldilinea sp.]